MLGTCIIQDLHSQIEPFKPSPYSFTTAVTHWSKEVCLCSLGTGKLGSVTATTGGTGKPKGHYRGRNFISVL